MNENQQTQTQSPQFYITAVRASENGDELLIDYQIPDEFKAWYKEKHNLKRWSRKRFEAELQTMVKKQIADNALKALKDPNQEDPRIRRELLEQWAIAGEKADGSK